MSSLQFSGDTRSVSIRTALSESSQFTSDTASATTAPLSLTQVFGVAMSWKNLAVWM